MKKIVTLLLVSLILASCSDPMQEVYLEVGLEEDLKAIKGHISEDDYNILVDFIVWSEYEGDDKIFAETYQDILDYRKRELEFESKIREKLYDVKLVKMEFEKGGERAISNKSNKRILYVEAKNKSSIGFSRLNAKIRMYNTKTDRRYEYYVIYEDTVLAGETIRFTDKSDYYGVKAKWDDQESLDNYEVSYDYYLPEVPYGTDLGID